MEVLKPFAVTDATLLYSNIAENDHAEWNSGTSYNLYDRVIVVAEHSVYESQTASNLNNDPTAGDETKWLKVGATNKWKPFDQKIGDLASNTETIEYKFSIVNKYLDSIALFGLNAAEVTVRVTDTVTLDIVHEETIELLDASTVVDGYTYFFEPFTYISEALSLDVPPYLNTELEVIISGGAGETVQVGQIVFGSLKRLGTTIYGTTLGIDDYSVKDRDQYGNYSIVPRTFADTVDFDVQYNTQTARQVQKFLASVRATPVVYIGSRETQYGTVVYGFFRSFEIQLQTPSLSVMTIQVEGLT